ncbi:MAG TPA: TerC family protein [Calidithermus sp.]|nr:TerC family protein [Calidithermus sp.]
MDFFTADALAALVTLAAMEIVLGIDNLVFIAILSSRLPRERQPLARRVGLGAALLTRVALLFAISWIMGLTRPLFSLGRPWSGRDLILLGGGLFLLFKATREIHDKLEGGAHQAPRGTAAGFAGVVAQIMILDIVFSLDSVITAVGMADDLWVMVTAMVVAMLVMLVSMEAVTAFIERHPTVKILALSFLLLIGVLLVAEGMGRHLEKGYVYFAMAFSLFVELLNMRYRARHAPVALHRRFEDPAA